MSNELYLHNLKKKNFENRNLKVLISRKTSPSLLFLHLLLYDFTLIFLKIIYKFLYLYTQFEGKTFSREENRKIVRLIL